MRGRRRWRGEQGEGGGGYGVVFGRVVGEYVVCCWVVGCWLRGVGGGGVVVGVRDAGVGG